MMFHRKTLLEEVPLWSRHMLKSCNMTIIELHHPCSPLNRHQSTSKIAVFILHLIELLSSLKSTFSQFSPWHFVPSIRRSMIFLRSLLSVFYHREPKITTLIMQVFLLLAKVVVSFCISRFIFILTYSLLCMCGELQRTYRLSFLKWN